MKYTVGSLFAGIGGICLGFKNARTQNGQYKLVWANEIDEYACQTYRANFRHTLLEGDINLIINPVSAEPKSIKNEDYYLRLQEKLLSEKIDILNGGFPCQAFSIAGERKGFDDERGNLFWSIINVVTMLGKKFEKPRVLFLENVKNLMTHDKGNTYRVIKGEIEKLGYTVKEKVLNTMYFSSLPQNRERIYIVCFRDKQDADKFTMFDKIDGFKRSFTKQERIRQIKDIIEYGNEIPEKYYYTKSKYPHYFITEDEYKSLNRTNGVRINLDEDINEMYEFYQVRRGMYVRKNMNGVCPTLTANMGTGGHNVPLIKDNKGVRKLSPAETLRLQGFPAGQGFIMPSEFKGKPFGDSYLYKQAGNAVSVPVIQLIAEEILKVLTQTDAEKD